MSPTYPHFGTMSRVSRVARLAARRRVSSSTTSTDAKTIPTYGERDAFFVGATATSGRGAYAARDVRAHDAVLLTEAPLACHRTLANATTRCDRCLRETDGAYCSTTCEEAAEREYAAWERDADARELEAYCAARGGLKFPLLVARIASKIASGSLKQSTVDWLCFANGVERDPPPQWLEECAALRRAFGEDSKISRDIITPAWYASVTSRLHLNSFRVEIPTAVDPSTMDFKTAVAAGLGAIESGVASGTAIYKLPSLFNHSCAPNARASWEHGDSSMTIRATRDIAAGEELTIAYVDVDVAAAARRSKLSEWYGFDCACSRCVAGE